MSTPVSSPDSDMNLPVSCGALYLTTSTGYPYIYRNGVAYFHCPNTSPPAHHWPVSSFSLQIFKKKHAANYRVAQLVKQEGLQTLFILQQQQQPAPPVMLPQSHQPVYQQPAYHHYQVSSALK